MKLTDQVIRNAIASGAIVSTTRLTRRRLAWGEKLALWIVFIGLACLGFVYGVHAP